MNTLELFPYQTEGVEWLSKKRVALLADEMGLGKSAQTIRAADKLGLRRILIVCPSIARLTWERELLKWSTLPNRKVRILKKRKEVPNARDEILICSFDYVSYNFSVLHDLRYDLLIVDESHYLKSIGAKRTQAVLSKKGVVHACARAWMVTGTPMPNHPLELWPLLYTFGITKLNQDGFREKFCNWYEFNGQKVVSGAKGSQLPVLRDLLASVMLRRKTKDVLKDLPSVRISDLPIEADLEALTPELKEQFAKIDSFLGGSGITDPLAQLKVLEGLASSVSSLRRFCVMQKIKPVCDLLAEELMSNSYDKIIIFAHHKEAVKEAAERLKQFGAVTVNGEVDAETRQRNIDSFQKDKNCRVFIGNIGAAGTNITLTAGAQVLFLEQAWVPGDNAQAVARAARIGQERKVNVRVASLAGTIDEQVQEILTRKMKDIFQLLG